MKRMSMVLVAGAVMASGNAVADFGSFAKGVLGKAAATADAASAAVEKAPASKAKMEKEEAERQAVIERGAASNKATQDRQDARKAEAETERQAQNVERKAELPWVMAQPGKMYQQEREKKFKEYIDQLGTAKKDDVIALRTQLRARAEEDRKIVKASASGWSKAEEELECYDQFLSQMWDDVLRFNWEGKADVAANTIQLTAYSFRVGNHSQSVRWCERDKVYCFHDFDTKEPDYVYDKADLNEINKHLNQLYFISCFCHGLEESHHKQTYGVAWFMVEKLQEAIKNNTKDRMTLHPRPEAGAMHKEFGKAAFKLAAAHEFFQGATEAIVLSDDWTIDRDKLGNITQRSISGCVLKPEGPGVRLLKAGWCQPYQGGGKYGDLKLNNWGGHRFWMK